MLRRCPAPHPPPPSARSLLGGRVPTQWGLSPLSDADCPPAPAQAWPQAGGLGGRSAPQTDTAVVGDEEDEEDS